MIWPLTRRSKSVLGIDIGTSVIKIVELLKQGEQEKLINYGFASVGLSNKRFPKKLTKDTLLLSATETAEIIKAILKTAGIKSQRVVFSIPDFTTFFTTFHLPAMSEEEITQAVQFEARRHVPLPLQEVTLDWSVTKGAVSSKRGDELEILLVVVPNETIKQYEIIVELCKFELLALEAEVFGLQRALTRGINRTVALIDIGAQSTTCSVVDRNVLKVSYSFDVAGNALTERLSKSLDIDYKAAILLKKEQGLLAVKQNVREILTPMFDLMLTEIQKATQSFYQQEGKEIQTYIIAGASSLLPGLQDYFSSVLKKEIKMANPFANIVYPPILEGTLKDIGPGFSVAVGMALKGLE